MQGEYVYIYIYIHTYIHTHTHIYICNMHGHVTGCVCKAFIMPKRRFGISASTLYIHTQLHIHAYYIYIYMCVCVCVCVCMYATFWIMPKRRSLPWGPIWVSAYALYILTHAHIRSHAHSHTCMHACIQAQFLDYECFFVEHTTFNVNFVFIQILIHTCMHACIHPYITAAWLRASLSWARESA